MSARRQQELPGVDANIRRLFKQSFEEREAQADVVSRLRETRREMKALKKRSNVQSSNDE